MAAARTRRTQAERTAATRAALLDATVDSIAELGYRATTTTEVAHRAGVSLGALLHHFPAKADLLTAAVVHAFERRRAEFREAMADIQPGEDKLGTAIDLLWTMYSGPTFTAYLELWVAARTDPELARAVVQITREFMTVSEALHRTVPRRKHPRRPSVPAHRAPPHLRPAGRPGPEPCHRRHEPYRTGEVLEAFKAVAQLALTVRSSQA